MKIDLHNNIEVKQVFDPAVPTATAAGNVGAIIDTANFNSHEILINYGTWTTTGAAFTLTLTECATTGGSFTSVADADLLGTEAGASVAAAATVNDDVCKKIGYKGMMRYIKPTVVANTATGVLCMTVIQSHGRKGPYSTQSGTLTS